MNNKRIRLLEDAIASLNSALQYESSDYPPLFAKQHTDTAEKLLNKWKESHKFAKLNGKWL